MSPVVRALGIDTDHKQIQLPIPEPEFIAEPTGLAFFVASMAFVALASTYYQAAYCNNRQGVILLGVSITGLLVAWKLDVGMLVGLYCIETWFVLLGLVVSDIFQAACQRRMTPKAAEEEQTGTDFERKWQAGLSSPV